MKAKLLKKLRKKYFILTIKHDSLSKEVYQVVERKNIGYSIDGLEHLYDVDKKMAEAFIRELILDDARKLKLNSKNTNMNDKKIHYDYLKSSLNKLFKMISIFYFIGLVITFNFNFTEWLIFGNNSTLITLRTVLAIIILAYSFNKDIK